NLLDRRYHLASRFNTGQEAIDASDKSVLRSRRNRTHSLGIKSGIVAAHRARRTTPQSSRRNIANPFILDPLLRRAIFALTFTRAHYSSHCFINLGGDDRRFEFADVFISDSALRIDEEGLRKSPHSVVNGNIPVRIRPVQVRNAKFLDKSARVVFLI